ncbi:NfeD family protein [Halochromatium salexigens]|uniref:Serine protease n=1 Tax=Halochromatium salexigens TaxID=49447 RepID=A0AAJ0UHB6_HALSE|nr:nodulation protein NfeD [Halochromatium salexigens]MBK5931464.1 serine protease [Halochromatium salexigens]
MTLPSILGTPIRSLIALLMLFATGPLTSSAAEAREALVIPIDGAIGAATGELVVTGLEQAAQTDAEIVVLRMDTPGGLDQAMRRIIKAILASPVPVASFVAPPGARAASAGTYILYASQIAAMAPATNLGAATPIQVGGGDLPGLGERLLTREDRSDSSRDGEVDRDEDAAGDPSGQRLDAEVEPAPAEAAPTVAANAKERKLVNDAVAYIRGLAELRGRNADWAEEAVRASVSLASGAAAERDVIDLVAGDIPTLLKRIDGRRVQTATGEQVLETAGLELRELEPDWRIELLSVIANPNVAYILLLIGIYGIIFELSNPGALFPGIVGAISLLLALYALQVLPVNYAGVGLILLGVLLMIGEALAPSFGALGVGGFAAFLFGSVILMDDEGAAVSWPVISITAGLSAALSIWVIGRFIGLRGKPSAVGAEQLVGKTAEARANFGGASNNAGQVHLEGELWQASSPSPVRRGEAVRVLAVNGLKLEVAPASSALERSSPDRSST